jgi:hypothetical protein
MLVPLAVIVLDPRPELFAVSLAPLAVLLLARLGIAITQHHPLASIAWHPVSAGVVVAGQALAIADHVIGRTPEGQADWSHRQAGQASAGEAPSSSESARGGRTRLGRETTREGAGIDAGAAEDEAGPLLG